MLRIVLILLGIWLAIWLALSILGFLVHALLWLAFIAVVLVVLSLAFGLFRASSGSDH